MRKLTLDVNQQIFGYEAPDLPTGWNLTTERQQLISSLMTLGAFVSSSCAGPIATFIGRKTTIWLASLLCVVSNIVMMTTTNIGGLYAGRTLLGLANGMYMTFAQLYIQECSPARYRGLMISSFQVWTSFGALVGTIVDNFTAKIDGPNSYLIPLGLIYIVPVLLSLSILFIPESPRWLMSKGRVEQARKALRWHRPGTDSDIDAEITDIQLAIDAESDREHSVAIMDMFRDPVDRRRTVLAVCGLTVQGASGAMYIIGEFPPCLAVESGTDDDGSVRNLLLPNSRNRRCVRELLHPERHRHRRNFDQQRCHHALRPSARIPHYWPDHLRYLAVAHCRGVPRQPIGAVDWQSNCGTRCRVHHGL